MPPRTPGPTLPRAPNDPQRHMRAQSGQTHAETRRKGAEICSVAWLEKTIFSILDWFGISKTDDKLVWLRLWMFQMRRGQWVFLLWGHCTRHLKTFRNVQSLLEFWWWSPREPMCLEPMLEQHIAANWTNYINFIYLFVKSTTTCTVSIRTPHLRLAVDLPIKSEACPGFFKTRGMHFCNHVNIYSRCYLNCRVVSHVVYSLKLYGHGNGSVFRVSMGILVSIQSLFHCQAQGSIAARFGVDLDG
jgi:hypothetical protein